jgi:phage portal protein BeeE
MARGTTGPVRRLEPFHPGNVTIRQDLTKTFAGTYTVTFSNGQYGEFQPSQILHARGPSRDGFKGDSIVMDNREAIGLEIAAERFGAMFYGNGATPGLVLRTAPGATLKTDEERKRLRDNIEQVYGRKGRHGVLILDSKQLELAQQVPIENEKAQQQSLAFVQNVVQPYVTIFEAAMERSLLTDEERAEGIIIRFNLDAALRADFLTRQQGLAIQRQNGVRSPNEWREIEGLNPREGGDTYLDGGTSGQQPTGGEPKPKPTDDEDDDDGDDDAED